MELLFLLLPVAAASGWWLGRRDRRRSATAPPCPDNHTPGYLKGLNYILNEQPDKAVEVFLQLVAVDSDTVETHLALASLFRRRGEVDRAIRIHQNLIARPTLTVAQRSQSLLELANDYMSAGLLDRAEGLFKELLRIGHHEREALRRLMEIYQQEKAWGVLIDTARQYQAQSSANMARVIAHCYCELSDAALESGDIKDAERQANLALEADRGCVRASLLLGDIAARREDYAKAMTHYRRVEEQDPDFLPETLERQAVCAGRLGQRSEFLDYVTAAAERHRDPTIVLAIARELQATRGDQSARELLLEQPAGNSSLEASRFLLELGLQGDREGDRRVTDHVIEQLGSTTAHRPVYQCRSCGLATQTLYWLCPSCQSWGTIKPRMENGSSTQP